LWARTRAGGRIDPPPYEGGGRLRLRYIRGVGRNSLLWRPALYGGGAAPPPRGGGSNGEPPPQGV
jgi:hypothetical protein